MGVITTAYSISPKMMRKIRENQDNLENIFAGEDTSWKVESYDFDKRIEEIISLLNESGYIKTAKKINCESNFYTNSSKYLDYDGYDIWYISPKQVKTIVEELESATFQELKAKGIRAEITDRRGNIIPESLYESYFGDFADIKKFFASASQQGNYLLFTEV